MKKFLLSFLMLFAIGSFIATAQTVAFHETFNQCEGTGGNDGEWSGNIGTGKIVTDIDGWVVENGGAGSECIKCGTSSKLGTATTPALGFEGTATMVFKAASWNNDETKLVLSIANGGELSQTEVTLENAQFAEYTVTLTGVTSASQITFAGSAASKERFWLDDVKITVMDAGEFTPAPTFSVAAGVYYEAQTVEINTVDGADVYYTIDGTTPTTTSTKYTTPIEVATTTTIKAIAVLDGVESEVAEATYTITNLFHGANFEEGICGYTFQDVELGDGLTYIWTLDEEWGYLKASAFVSGSNIAGESWAVSPEIDLTKAETAELQLTEAVNFLRGEDLERYCMIMISKNYIDNVNTADWTQLEATNRPAGDSWSECTIDPVDLAEFVGNKVRLAFCYVSTTNAAPTWEIFNVNITGEIGGSVSVDAVAAEEGTKAIGGNGEIVIVGEASNVEVYNIAGALVEEGNLTNIPCATGIYVVKVDGKAQKVIVK